MPSPSWACTCSWTCRRQLWQEARALVKVPCWRTLSEGNVTLFDSSLSLSTVGQSGYSYPISSNLIIKCSITSRLKCVYVCVLIVESLTFESFLPVSNIVVESIDTFVVLYYLFMYMTLSNFLFKFKFNRINQVGNYMYRK